MVCDSCRSSFSADEISDYDGFHFEEEVWKEDEAVLYRCPSCGRELILEKNNLTTKCSFCQSNLVIGPRLSGTLKPNSIIPFRIDADTAKGLITEYLRNSGMRAKELKGCTFTMSEGMYVPFWTYSARFYESVVITCSDSDNITDVSLISTAVYQSIPVDASEDMPNEISESLEPYDFKEAVPFNIRYLSGFSSERYTVGAKISLNRAKQRMTEDLQDLLEKRMRRDYCYVNLQKMTTRSPTTVVRYVLCPVWFIDMYHGGMKYRYYVNGQTGKVSGKVPSDYESRKRRSIIALMLLELIPMMCAITLQGQIQIASVVLTQLAILYGFFFVHRKIKRPIPAYIQKGAAFYMEKDSAKILYHRSSPADYKWRRTQ